MSIIGLSTHVARSAGRLVVTEPINPFIVVPIAGLTVWPLLLELARRPRRKVRITVWTVIAGAALGLFTSACRLTLDRASDTATIADFMFFHWSSRTMPLDRLAGASLRTGSTTAAIELRFADGRRRSMSELTQTGGKDHAIHAINAFLDGEPAP